MDYLYFQISEASRHDRRTQPIVQKATAILADQLTQRCPATEIGLVNIEHLSAAPVRLDLNALSDEQVAEQIANAWLEALALKLKV